MLKYTDYLKATVPARSADLAVRRQQFTSLMEQLQKNASAPVVSGSGGSGSSGGYSSASSQSLSNNFKTVGGKVLPVNSRVSQNWGASRIKYAAGRHTGMDFGAKAGTPLRSAGNGVVSRVGREGAYGNTIHVRQADGTTAMYAHLSGANVKPGQRVKAGQFIGRTGNTGRSFGAHLHFEIRTRDRYGGDINPRGWLGR
jgi:murein DD-endopeptidase MepM/ murein hydrolase activator NlpD